MIRPDQRFCGQNPVTPSGCASCVDNRSAARTRRDSLLALAGQADVITYPSRYAMELSEASGLPRGKGRVWENGITPPGPGFAKMRERRRREDPRLCFGFLGGPSHIKGWPLVAETFSRITAENFRGIVIDGSRDGTWWRGQDLSPLSGSWEILPRFAQGEIDDFYAQIDVLLFLSQWKETFGLSLREAAARGIAIVQTDSGGTMEHAASEYSDVVAIGDGPEKLLPIIKRLLNGGSPERPAITTHSWADQTQEFKTICDALCRASAHPQSANPSNE